MTKNIIVAIADNLAIGKDNDLLWHISEDLKYFKKITTGCSVIMGFRTFLSLGSKALPNRRNIVISELDFPDAPANIEVVASLDKAFDLVKEENQCFVIGGGYTYAQAMNVVDKLYITHVHTTIENADTFFPEIDSNIWEIESKSETHIDPETNYPFEFVIYKRK